MPRGWLDDNLLTTSEGEVKQLFALISSYRRCVLRCDDAIGAGYARTSRSAPRRFNRRYDGIVWFICRWRTVRSHALKPVSRAGQDNTVVLRERPMRIGRFEPLMLLPDGEHRDTKPRTEVEGCKSAPCPSR